MCADADGTNAGSAAAMGNAEGLVQVQVADVGAELARLADPDHGVDIGTVHIDLTAMRMNQIADLGHGLFKHTVSRRIGDHQTGETVAVLFNLGFQIAHINIAVIVAFHHHDRHP